MKSLPSTPPSGGSVLISSSIVHVRLVVVAYFCRAFVARKLLQKREVNIDIRLAVALLAQHQIDLHRKPIFLVRHVLLAWSHRLVENSNEVGILFDTAAF